MKLVKFQCQETFETIIHVWKCVCVCVCVCVCILVSKCPDTTLLGVQVSCQAFVQQASACI